MVRDIILVSIGALFGLGATMAGVAAPPYFPTTPPWIWQWIFWCGVALMAIMAIDLVCLLTWRPRFWAAIFLNGGLVFLALAVIAQFSPIHQSAILREITAASRPMRLLSNIQLRDAAIDLAAKMRTFEANSTPQINPMRFPPGATEEQKTTLWNEMIKRDQERRDRQRVEFSNTYLGNAQQLRDEIIFRLRAIGVLEPYVDLTPIESSMGPEVLNGGLLAGPYPISSAANYLEKLARRLPTQ